MSRNLVRRLRTDGDPMLRVLAVLEPLHITASTAQAEEPAR